MSPLLLLHGVGLDHRMWDRCLPALRRRHRVSAPDLPGHGSAAPAGGGITVSDLAAAVRPAEPAHVVGFSLGALVAQCLAVEEPGLVRSLTLVSSVARRTPEQAAAVRARLAAAQRSPAETADAAIGRWMSPEWRAAEPELAGELRRTLLGNDHASYLACYRVFATADEWLWPRIGGITAPTLAVTGAADPGSTPEMTRLLASRIPGARAVVVPGAQQLLPLEEPDLLTEEILSHTEEADRGQL
ncbi:alpha/beta fold hydrolase [Amycolatopsis ruanii]|uniref:alpha/beta fold hydrolase n=1 Tax=Amycolatopsis ruanii TaxID=944491 RepID=UPI000E24591F|nr:alpha/beta fold hydrolase [Amycolatopsis ruanii]